MPAGGASAERPLDRHVPGNKSQMGEPGLPADAPFEMVRMEFLAANTQADPVGSQPLSGQTNFILGDLPARWRTDVPSYGQLTYSGLFPGVDLVFRGEHGRIQCEMVGPQASDMAKVRVRFSGTCPLSVDATGALTLDGTVGRATFRPLAGLTFDEALEGTYAVRMRPERPLTSPASASVGLSYGTYLGGGGSESAWSLFVDSAGSVYVAGFTLSVDFPTVGQFQTDQGGYDAFVLKLKAQGDSLEYATYIGGSSDDQAFKLKVDGLGNVYLTGYTLSSDFPILNPLQPDSGGADAFVVKLNAAGNALEYGTYLGGSLEEYAFGIDVDDDGNAYVTGRTTSTDFPLVNAFQPDQAGRDCFVSKLSASGNGLLYSTYLGGGNDEQAFSIRLDTSGTAFVAGTTNSADFPTQGPYQTHQGDYDGFVARLNAAGNGLVYATYMGGTLRDEVQAIEVDSAGNLYATGLTESVDFPTANPFQADPGDAEYDAYVLKLNPAGSGLLYSTYLGGSIDDYAYAIAIDPLGSAYVSGVTGSTDFPTLNGFQTDQGDYDAFVTRVDPSGDVLVYSTYLGGTDLDYADGVALDLQGGLYIAGTTYSTDFPTQNPYQGDSTVDDGFVVRLACTDLDNDCIADGLDNCPATYNPLQEDADVDFIGDACDVGDTLVFSLYSPVDFIITDPAGDSIGIDSVSRVIFNTILQGSTYDTLTDENSSDLTGPDGQPDDIVIIPSPLAGPYRVKIIREPGASPSDHFTEGIRINGNQQLIPDFYNYATLASLGTPQVPAETTYTTALTLPGDTNADGVTSAADIIFMVNYVFKGGLPPTVTDHGDANCDGLDTSADIIMLVNYIFKSGAAPCSQSAG